MLVWLLKRLPGLAAHRSRVRACATFAIACLALPAPASSAAITHSAVSSGSPDISAIDRYVQSEMDAQRIPGLALGIVGEGSIIHLRGFGVADAARRPVTPQTPFFIGSVTKSFTSLAVMQLSEAGRVDLDAPVRRYLPWWRVADLQAATSVTVRQLLYQVSGLSRATGNAYATGGETGPSALEDRVRALRFAELAEAPGTTWQYSNANYWTLGLIVQAVSGQSYETYIQQHIFDPLQMRRSFTSQAQAEQHGLPVGHRYWYGFPVPAELPFDRGGVSAGGLASSAEDMAGYLGLYLAGGRSGSTMLVSPAGASELQRAAVPTGVDGVSYGMGWEVTRRNGVRTISHDGSEFTAHANVVLVPERGWGVVLMENAENSPDEFFGSGRMTGIANGVTDLLIGRQPALTSVSPSLWVTYAVVLGIILIQAAGLARSLRALRRWRMTAARAPSGVVQISLHLGVPLLLSWSWAVIVFVLLPRTIGAPLPVVLVGLPDIGYPLVISAAVALVWSLIRLGAAISTLRARPPSGPSDIRARGASTLDVAR